MRPMYERPSHLAAERAAIGVVEGAWRVRAVKLPIAYGVDYALTRDNRAVCGFVEVKCRNNASGQYPTYLLSLGKLLAARRLAAATRLPFALVVTFSDGAYFWLDGGEEVAVEIGGRADRGDWQDTEPCAMIPMSRFKPLLPDGLRRAA
jgi:hypothetical protein